MPFIELSELTATKTTSNFAKPPIFLLPGIIGYGGELYNLGKELDYIFQSNRPIYVYWDPMLISSENSVEDEYQGLEKQAESIVAEIFAKFNYSENPWEIVAYSFGCVTAAFVAKYLQKNYSQPSSLYLIDGPTPDSIQNYFKNKPESAVEDILSVINYAAQLSNLNETSLSLIEKKTLKNLSLKDRLDFMENKIYENNPELHKEQLVQIQTYLKIIKRNLQNIMHYKPNQIALNKQNEKIFSIKIMFTNITEKKYDDSFDSWQKYAGRISRFGIMKPESADEQSLICQYSDDHSLIYQQHHNLLATENSEQLARSIMFYFYAEESAYSLLKAEAKLSDFISAASSIINHNFKQYENCRNQVLMLANYISLSSPLKKTFSLPLPSSIEIKKETKLLIQIPQLNNKIGSNPSILFSNQDKIRPLENKNKLTLGESSSIKIKSPV